MWSWSKALLILDENSLKYRIEELSNEAEIDKRYKMSEHNLHYVRSTSKSPNLP